MGYKITKVPVIDASIGPSESSVALTDPFSLSAEAMRNGFRLELKFDACDVTTQVDIVLTEQMADGSVTNQVLTVNPTDQATGATIKVHPGVAASAALMPLLPLLQLIVSVGVGDLLEVSDIWLIQADE